MEDGPVSRRPPAGPRFPFQDWPVQLSTSVGYIWYTSPGVLVSQLVIERASLEDAKKLTGFVDEVVRIERDDFAALGCLLILHDWKISKAYDAPARGHLFAHTRTRQKGDVRGVVVSLTLNSSPTHGGRSGQRAAHRHHGRSIEIVAAISSALRKHGVGRPTDDSALTGVSV